ncbi:MAG: SPOR domain-containing protein [Alphaproteobacteria bacterium]|nr:MAG: SPOR domain-containing protein [Alphaproteobacteria bacterium]
MRVLRRQVEQLARREETLNERLSALESALGPQTSALPPQQPIDPAAVAKRRQSRLSAPVPGADVSYLPLPEDGFASTGVTPSPLPVASITKTTRTLFAIEVAKAASMEELMERWKTLKKKHEDLLGALKLRTQKSERGDGSHAELKLVAGPFSNAADAAKLCAKLKAAGAACAETVFTGEEM